MYDYLEAIKEDVANYIQEEEVISRYDSRDDMEEDLNEILFNEDMVTGNATGSYTCDEWDAQQNLCWNWDLLLEALENFNQTDINPIKKGAEWCDVTIRCYLLSQAISEVLDELEEKGKIY